MVSNVGIFRNVVNTVYIIIYAINFLKIVIINISRVSNNCKYKMIFFLKYSKNAENDVIPR